MDDIYFQGVALTIKMTPDFSLSLDMVMAIHHKNNDAHLAKGEKLIKQLANAGKLRSPDQFRQEGQGFWAIKAGKIRFYGWYERDKIFVLSHVIFKSTDKLAQADVNRMQKNQNKFRSTKAKK